MPLTDKHLSCLLHCYLVQYNGTYMYNVSTQNKPACIAYLYSASGSATAASCSTQVFALSKFP